jgi:RHS repeat-associated protein
MSYDAYGRQTASGATSPFGFTGQQTDAESGLVYLRARYYDPSTASFLQRDPAPFDASLPTGIDRYIYASDNPTTATDLTGLSSSLWPSWLPPISVGGSGYDVVGGEVKVTFSGEGFSTCGGVGVGFGGGFTEGVGGTLDETGVYGKVHAGFGPFVSADLGGRYNFARPGKCAAWEGIHEGSVGPVSYDCQNFSTEVNPSALTHLDASAEASATVGGCYKHSW